MNRKCPHRHSYFRYIYRRCTYFPQPGEKKTLVHFYQVRVTKEACPTRAEEVLMGSVNLWAVVSTHNMIQEKRQRTESAVVML